MKRIALIFFVLMGLLGCKKETTPADPTPNPPQNEYYIRFKVDGVLEEYKSTLIAPQGQFNIKGNNQTFVSAVAVFKDFNVSSTANYISLNVITQGYLAAVNTVYTTNQTTIPGAIQDDLFSLVYFSPDSENFICSSLAEFNGKVSDGRITFSEVTQTSLKGVFSGNFYNADYSKTIAITEGEFFVKRYF